MTLSIQPNTRLSRAIALLIGSILLAAVSLGVVWPFALLVADYRQRLVDGRETLERFRAVEAHGAGANSPTTTAAAYATDFLQGAQEALVLAELQNRLRAMAVGREIEVNSSTALPNKTIGGHVYLGMRLSLRGPMKDVHAVIHAVETSMPLLFVERVALMMDGRRLPSREPGFEGPFALVADLDVFGAHSPAEISTVGAQK